MSYDVYVFFGERERDLAEAAEVTRLITGIEIAEDDTTRLLGISLELQPRSLSLVDREGLPFSTFGYQLEMTCASQGGELIHQIGVYLAEQYSSRLKERSMLCLNGVEYLGAIFDKGRLVVDQMLLYSKIHYSGPWRYSPELFLRK